MTFLTAVDIDDRPLGRSASVPGFLRPPSAGKGPCAPAEEKCKFLHEESNYYSKLPVKPGAFWLRGLLETKTFGEARRLLARFRVEFPRTLIFGKFRGGDPQLYLFEVAAMVTRKECMSFRAARPSLRGLPAKRSLIFKISSSRRNTASRRGQRAFRV